MVQAKPVQDLLPSIPKRQASHALTVFTKPIVITDKMKRR
jgi:hypothetical protein